jgi:hypothetical protein
LLPSTLRTAGFEVPPPRVEEPVAAPVLAAAQVEDEV